MYNGTNWGVYEFLKAQWLLRDAIAMLVLRHASHCLISPNTLLDKEKGLPKLLRTAEPLRYARRDAESMLPLS